MKAVYNIMNKQDKVTKKQFYHIRCDPDLDKGFCAMRRILCASTECVEKYTIPGYLTRIETYNYVLLPNPKYVSTLPSYVAIINLKKETTNPDEMEIKDALVLNSINWAASEDIEYNTIGALQTSGSNKPGYYIF